MANWASVERLGDPSSADWQAKNLADLEVGDQKWRVYAPARAAFEGLINDLIKQGYNPLSSGGFNYRNIRGSDRLSQHAFGTAIDMNAATNALGSASSDIPNAAELAKKWGLEWGGNWKNRPDPMHFEYMGGAQGVGGAGVAPAGTEVNQAPARSVGGAGVVPVGTPPLPVPDQPPEATPEAAVTPPLPEKDKKHWLTAFAEGMKPSGEGPGVQMSRAQHPGAALVEAPAVAPVAQADPNRRAMLAQIMAQLNSGRLFG